MSPVLSSKRLIHLRDTNENEANKIAHNLQPDFTRYNIGVIKVGESQFKEEGKKGIYLELNCAENANKFF